MKPKKAKMCVWENGINNYWETDCLNLYVFANGTPKENKMKFCPFCGGKIREGK